MRKLTTLLLFFCVFSSIAQNTLDNVDLPSGVYATGAYSLRKIATSYSGSILKVRRSSDNARAYINFDGSNTVSGTSGYTFIEGSVLTASIGTARTGTISNGVTKTGTITVQVNKTGTLTSSVSSSTVTGVGTSFLTELSAGDILYKTTNEPIGTVISIESNTSLTLNAYAGSTNTNISFRNNKASVTGSGTSFLTELTVGDVILNSSNSYLGVVSSISSNTSLTLESFDATAATSVNYKSTSNTISGSGTAFLSEVSVGDMIIANNVMLGIVQSIESNTSLTLASASKRALTSQSFRTISSTGSFSSFYASTSVFVEQWYDQSGNSNHLIQRITGNQPRLVNAGTLTTVNSRVAIQFGFSGTAYLHSNTPASWLNASTYTVNKITAETNLSPSNMYSVSTWGGNGPGSSVFHTGYRNNSQITVAHYGNDMNFNAVSTTDLEAHTAMFTNPGSKLYRNGGLITTAASNPGTALSNVGIMSVGFYRPTSTNYQGYFTELINFQSLLSDANRSLLEENQMTYYSIGRTVWTGAVDADWNNSSNWSNGIPTISSPTVVIIPNTTNKPIISSGTASVRSLTIETSGSLTINAGGTLKIRGAINAPNASINAQDGSFEFDGTTGLGVPMVLNPAFFTSNTIGNLTINSSDNVSLAAALVVKSNLTFQLGKLIMGANALTLNGTITNTVSQGLRGSTSADLTLNLNSSSTVSMDQTTVGTTNLLRNLTVNSGSSTVTFANDIQLYGNTTLSSGIVDLGSNKIDRSSAGGTFTISAAAQIKIGGTNTFPSNYSTHSISSSSIIEFSGSNQTISPLNSSQTFGNLYLSGSGTKTFADSLTIVNDVKIASGIIASLGIKDHNAKALYLNDVNQSSGSYGGTGSSAATINTTYFSANTGTLFVSSGNFTWIGTTSDDWNTAANWSVNSVPVSTSDVYIPASTPYQPTVSSSANCANLRLGASATLAVNSTLTVAGSISNEGATVSGSGTIAMTGSSKTITGTATNLLNFIVGNGATISLTGSHTSTSISYASGSVNSTFTLAGTSTLNVSSTIDISQGASNSVTRTLNIDASTLTVEGLISFSGTASTNSSRIQEIVITTGTLNANAGMTFATVNNAGRRIVTSAGAGRINLKGTLTLGGQQTFTAGTNGATFCYCGTSAQTMYNFSSGGYHHVIIDNSSGVTLGAAISTSTLTGNLTVASGTLSNGGFAIVGNSSRTLSLTAGANLYLSGTGSFSGFGTVYFNDNTTVEYNSSSAQTIGAGNYYNLTINGSRSSNNITLSSTGTIEIRNTIQQNATFTSGTFISTSSTVKYSKNSGNQNVAGISYNNLTLTNSSQKYALGDMTVNGVLSLASNISADLGHLEMTTSYTNYAAVHSVDNTSVYNSLSSYILTLGASATISGTGDVTGKIKRTSFVDGTSYSFANANNRLTFTQNGGTLPSQITVTATIGAHGLHVDKDGTADYTSGTADTLIGGAAVKRMYQINRTGGTSEVRFTLRFNYLDAEMNGNTESKLVVWDHHLPYGGITPHEHGKTNQSTSQNWIELSNHGLFYLATDADPTFTKYWMLSQKVTTDTLWLGAASGNWNTGINWSSGAVPGSYSKVIIDKNIYKNELTVDANVSVGSIRIQPDAVVNGSTSTITLNGSPLINGGAGTWYNLGTFNPGSSTIVINSTDGTISGSTQFYNLTINSGKKATIQSGAIDTISNSLVINGILDAASNTNTIVFTKSGFSIPTTNAVNAGYSNISINTSGTVTSNQVLNIKGDLLINGGTFVNTSDLSLKGNLSAFGAIDESNGKYIFDGQNQQVIEGVGTIHFWDFELNNSKDIDAQIPIRVKSNLNLIAGDLLLNGQTLEIGSSTSQTGVVNWTDGTVVGKMRRWYATSASSSQGSGLFPVGKSDYNRYAQINFTSSSSGGYIEVEYLDGEPTGSYTLPLSYTSGGATKYIQNADQTGYWSITPYSSSGVIYGSLDDVNYDLKLRINDPLAVQQNGPLSDPPNMRVIRAKGNPDSSHDNWTLAASNATITPFSGSVLGTDYVVSSNGLTGFSWFNIGGDNQNPLPVELLSFQVNCNQNELDFSWSTASEFNSDYFVVEGSRDGENWTSVETISATGNSNKLVNYAFHVVDLNTYFRLKQVDKDGMEKTYDPVAVFCDDNSKTITLPNPSGQNFTILYDNKLKSEYLEVLIRDVNGKIVSTFNFPISEGINQLFVKSNLPSGVYFVELLSNEMIVDRVKHSIE